MSLQYVLLKHGEDEATRKDKQINFESGISRIIKKSPFFSVSVVNELQETLSGKYRLLTEAIKDKQENTQMHL